MAEDKELLVRGLSATGLWGGAPGATCLRGLHDKFPTTWLCHTVCHLDNNWGHSRVAKRWHRGLHREGPLSLNASVYFRSACSTSRLIRPRKSAGLKINKTLLTVIFTLTCLFVTINHAYEVWSTLPQQDPHTNVLLQGCQTEKDGDECNPPEEEAHDNMWNIVHLHLWNDSVEKQTKQNSGLPGLRMPPELLALQVWWLFSLK